MMVTTVFVAQYKTPLGDRPMPRVFTTSSAAEQWREEIASDGWDTVPKDERPDTDDSDALANAWFDSGNGEYFWVNECEVEDGDNVLLAMLETQTALIATIGKVLDHLERKKEQPAQAA